MLTFVYLTMFLRWDTSTVALMYTNGTGIVTSKASDIYKCVGSDVQLVSISRKQCWLGKYLNMLPISKGC